MLVGQVTEQCILYSALDAYVRHFAVAVPCDAVAGIHDDLADAALRMMERNMRADVCAAQDCGSPDSLPGRASRCIAAARRAHRGSVVLGATGLVSADEGAAMPPAPRPRMKSTAPLLRGGGLLHIVGSGSVHTMADPDGAIHRLVELADGSRSVDELLGVLQPDYPQIDEQDVAAAVRELESAGVFETAGSARRPLLAGHRPPRACRALRVIRRRDRQPADAAAPLPSDPATTSSCATCGACSPPSIRFPRRPSLAARMMFALLPRRGAPPAPLTRRGGAGPGWRAAAGSAPAQSAPLRRRGRRRRSRP